MQDYSNGPVEAPSLAEMDDPPEGDPSEPFRFEEWAYLLEEGAGSGAYVQEFTERATRRRPWADFAVCRGIGPAIFFPERGQNAAARRAADICRECPVRVPCLIDCARDSFDWKKGIRGGLTPIERRHRLDRLAVAAGKLTEEQIDAAVSDAVTVVAA